MREVETAVVAYCFALENHTVCIALPPLNCPPKAGDPNQAEPSRAEPRAYKLNRAMHH